jgi:hypothetical protein
MSRMSPVSVVRTSSSVFFAAAWLGSAAYAQPDADDHTWSPAFVVGGDLGVAAMNENGPLGFGDGVGTVTHPGPAWGVRVGIDLFSWLGVEARYVGMFDPIDKSVSPTGSVGFLTTGGEAVARLVLPLPFLHPYVFAGFGYYNVAVVGSATARAGSVLFSSSQPGIPMGFGIDAPVSEYLSIAVEATYRFQLGENYSAVTANGIDGGDLTSLVAVARIRL